MPREQKIEIGVVNIVTHPHSPENYAELWLHAASLQRAVKMHGDTYGLIATAFPVVHQDPTKGITGDIYRFTHINMEADWFDLAKGEILDPEDVEQQVTIPENLKPNTRRLRYIFFPAKHRMVFTTKLEDGTLSPRMAEALLKRTFSDPRLSHLAHSVEVTAEQEREQLEEIFQKLALRRLEITVKVPNSDGGAELSEQIEEALREERAQKLIEIRIAEKNQSLQPSERTKKLAKIAMSNGSVQGNGYDENGDKQSFDTESHPVRISEVVPEQVSFATWFVDKARQILTDLL